MGGVVEVFRSSQKLEGLPGVFRIFAESLDGIKGGKMPEIVLCKVGQLVAKDKGDAGVSHIQGYPSVAELHGLLGEDHVTILEAYSPGIPGPAEYNQMGKPIGPFIRRSQYL